MRTEVVTPAPSAKKPGTDHGVMGPTDVTTSSSVLTVNSTISTFRRVFNPRILLWTEPGTKRLVEGTHLPAAGDSALRYCSFPVRDSLPRDPFENLLLGCYVTTDRSLLERSDAVVFDASAIHATLPPEFRDPRQVWVFWTHRGSVPTKDLGTMTADSFNWTMARRMDADVVIPFGNWTISDKPASSDYVKKEQIKKGTALFFTSDCDEDDTNHVLKDVMGALEGSTVYSCGVTHCGWFQMCLAEYAKDFYFLLVPESSGCYEHPLEAIYGALRFGLVPVYFGNKELKGLPEHSFVSALALMPSQNIASYLKALIDDLDLYSDFFKWKETYALSHRDDLCYLCDSLRAPFEKRSADVLSWWKKTNLCPLDHKYNQAHSLPHDAYML
ncbi:alpha-(1,3)-fucosyltransferase C-like [Dermacentor variabilis]|uniref:alpha-(1,3)-fucosyltransferase C-like n=1 Tax=Dermacentor variabilis TaxID=34621 RepID=UPI003F5B6106